MCGTDDDVAEQARHARALAPAACAPTGCAWYHGIWPTLRALGLVASPERHGELFRQAVRGVVERPAPRILVSGAADGAMLGLVLDALDGLDGAGGAGVAVTVLDRCATPVEVSVAAAARRGRAVEGWVTDVLDADTADGFDLVCTHGLLPMTPRGARPALCASWRRLLRPGGRVVTTTSLADTTVDRVRFADDAVDGFATRAGQAAAAAGATALGSTPAAIEAAARCWAARAEVYPVGSTEELGELLSAAGLGIVEIGTREVEGRLGSGSGGPWSARTARYAEVVAERPAP